MPTPWPPPRMPSPNAARAHERLAHDASARDFRLIPIVLLATICLFALKVSGLVFDGGYTLAERLQGRNKTDMRLTTAKRAGLSQDRRGRQAAVQWHPPHGRRPGSLGAGDVQLTIQSSRRHRFDRQRGQGEGSRSR